MHMLHVTRTEGGDRYRNVTTSGRARPMALACCAVCPKNRDNKMTESAGKADSVGILEALARPLCTLRIPESAPLRK